MCASIVLQGHKSVPKLHNTAKYISSACVHVCVLYMHEITVIPVSSTCDMSSRCVTFENPGVAKYWRKKAEKAHDQQHWEKKVLNYVTYPNPINTCLPHIGQVVRLQLGVHKS